VLSASDLSKNESISEIFDVTIQKGMFDIVILSLMRCLTGLICYGVLRWITRLPIILTTVVSTIYIIAKAGLYEYTQLPPLTLQPLYVMIFFFMLLSSVVIPWFATFFFEFKYLAGELAYYKEIKWSNWRSWLWPRALKRVNGQTIHNVQPNDTTPLLPSVGGGSDSSSIGNGYQAYSIPHRTHHHEYSTPYLTPVGSEGDISSPDTLSGVTDNSSTTPESSTLLVNLSPEELQYKTKSDQTLQQVDELLLETTVWTLEKNDTTNKVKTYSHPSRGPKIYKIEAFLPYAIDDIWAILCTEVTLYPEWNPEILENKILHKINDAMDILYTVTGPQAGGMVSCRDFVSLRTIVSRPDEYMSLGTAVEYDGMPRVNGRIRGENIVSAYVIRKEAEDTTKAMWIVQTDLKGWLPKYLIEQALSSLLGQTIINLQQHLKRRYGEHVIL
jgi:hypothetical protein